MVGAHTDSPCLKLRPVSKNSKSGFLMVNVETYGGEAERGLCGEGAGA